MNMHNGIRWPGPALALLAALAGCASPDPRLYTLAATDGAMLPAAGQVVELRRVDIPGYLDRPEIVRSTSDFRVHLATNDRWSEPFGALVQRVLTDDLARRLPGASVYSDAGSMSAKATQVVEIDLRRLDADGAGLASLDAAIAIRSPDDTTPALTRAVHLTAPAGPATPAYAAALSTLTGQLADSIAQALTTPARLAQPPAS